MKIAAGLIGLAMLGACATTPEPCTPEWVEWKSEKILKRFAYANYGEVKRLRDFSEDLRADDIGPLTALQIPGMIQDFKALAEDFEADVLPALNDAVDQCGSVQALAPALTEFLRGEGV
ncbi:MAG: hypothetical protein K0U61_12330, partial [Alphaproteobacteria bacterium]|nr:hypothetical protein [Alphaproteobacteria bacterium]